jgi:hypothetical protein
MPEERREQGALTVCQAQREGQVRTLRESKRVGDAHSLSSTEGRTSQDNKNRLESKGYSLPKEHRGREKSGRHEKARG